jgi:dipeptidyl aminopeptidase/acylaminoacyl peptidase
MPTGELFGVNADGSEGRLLIGHSDPSLDGAAVYTFVANDQFAELIDTLPRDDRNVLVAMSNYDVNPTTRVVRMDVLRGKTSPVAVAPLHSARFATDADGVVRFAVGTDRDNYSQLLYRENDKSPWRTINEEKTSEHIEWPIGFSADGKTAYLQAQQAQGPDALLAFDTATGKRTPVLRDATVDPESIVYRGSDGVPVGATFMTDRRRSLFFDEQSEAARVQRSLEAAFPDASVVVTSRTHDGQLLVVLVSSDTNPGDFYLYDLKTKAANGIFSRRTWLDPGKMAATKAVEFPARDGLPLHAYLTLPAGKAASALPMVLLPHGGPFGIVDTSDFDEEVQMLAQAGYAVLRVNYRGSGGYGRAFMHAGAKQWGRQMQDDLADATRWAAQQKIADPARVCIFGGSYGAYAALTGLARDPALYRCGVGYVGVYDLPMMYDVDAAKDRSIKIWLGQWVGNPDTLAEISPTRLAKDIKAPVFLAAGGKDTRAPIKQTQRMEQALKQAGAAPEVLYFPTEGHGFYTQAHRQEFYAKLLDFLSRNIGGEKAK